MNIKEINKLNKKGFTLIELLGVIVILAVISGIATYGVISVINTSKLKSEKIFIDKLSNLIDDYLDLYPPTEKTGIEYKFNKCIDAGCSQDYEVTATKMGNNPINISDLVTTGIVTYEDLINPKNRNKCFSEDHNPEIIIYKDSDYVYHYYVDLTNNACDLDNTLIDNMPNNLIKELNDNGVNLPPILKETIS